MKFNETYIQDFASKLLLIPSPTGYSHRAISFLEEEATNLGYRCEKNQKGNLLVYVDGKDSSKTVGISGHVDTLGLMVRSITSSGNLKVTNLGGPIISTLDGEYCTILTRDHRTYTGTILFTSPSIHVYKDAESGSRTIDSIEVRLDEVVKSKQDVEDLGICNGDFIAIDPKTTWTDSGFIKSRFLDDKISVAIMFGVLKQMKEDQLVPKNNHVFIISTYEEVGHGTAWIPDGIEEMLAVDMGCIGKDLTCTEYDVSICAKDSSGPYDYEMTSELINLAKQESCTYAVDIYPMYSSDVSAALRGGQNIKGALIGPGVHASHGMERTHMDAILSTSKLLCAFIMKS